MSNKMVLLKLAVTNILTSHKFITSVDVISPFIDESSILTLNLEFPHISIRQFTDLEILKESSIAEKFSDLNHVSFNCALVEGWIHKNGHLDDFLLSDDDFFSLEKEVFLESYITPVRNLPYYSTTKNFLRNLSGKFLRNDFDNAAQGVFSVFGNESYLYDTHSPQVLNGEIFVSGVAFTLDAVSYHSISESNFPSHWNIFGNSLEKLQIPHLRIPYETISWPPNARDWTPDARPRNLRFENFYFRNYQKGGIFEGLDLSFDSGVIALKKQRWIDHMDKYW